MSETTQPPPPGGYDFWGRQIEVLGDREPMRVLAETPDELLRILSQHSEEDLRRRPAQGGWSAAEVIGHLLDTEWIFGFRLRTILCDAEPTFPGVDQDLWVARQRWNRRSVLDTVGRFGVLRAFTVDFYRELTQEDLDRRGLHTGADAELSLDLMERIQAGHDLVHLAQIERCLEAEPEAQ